MHFQQEWQKPELRYESQPGYISNTDSCAFLNESKWDSVVFFNLS